MDSIISCMWSVRPTCILKHKTSFWATRGSRQIDKTWAALQTDSSEDLKWVLMKGDASVVHINQRCFTLKTAIWFLNKHYNCKGDKNSVIWHPFVFEDVSESRKSIWFNKCHSWKIKFLWRLWLESHSNRCEVELPELQSVQTSVKEKTSFILTDRWGMPPLSSSRLYKLHLSS